MQLFRLGILDEQPPHFSDLDGAMLRPWESRSDRDGLLHVRRFDQVESRHEFLGLGERPIDDTRPGRPRPDRDRGGARLESFRLDEMTARPQLLVELEMPDVEAVHLVRGQIAHLIFIEVDQAEVSHQSAENGKKRTQSRIAEVQTAPDQRGHVRREKNV